MIKKGLAKLGKFRVERKIKKNTFTSFNGGPYKLCFGPGEHWKKPSSEWLDVDIDPLRADIAMNFNKFEKFPLQDESVLCIYGSHVFEHMSIFKTPKIFKDCFRVLKNDGFMRMILPDARKSIEEYINGNYEFPLFKKRIKRAEEFYGLKYTLFEAMKEDFLSKAGQKNLLGQDSLAHQNSWDFETLQKDLIQAGFEKSKIKRTDFKITECVDFRFEGTYPSEANQQDRSMYVEIQK